MLDIVRKRNDRVETSNISSLCPKGKRLVLNSLCFFEFTLDLCFIRMYKIINNCNFRIYPYEALRYIRWKESRLDGR